jgi:putative membrane protein insertion efficiency factor
VKRSARPSPPYTRPSTLKRLTKYLRELFLLPLHAYRKLISPALPPRCKYYPSCSAYAVQAVRELGVIRGSIVAAWRVVRCNPWSLGGVDELADRRLFRDRTEGSQDHLPHPKPLAAASPPDMPLSALKRLTKHP